MNAAIADVVGDVIRVVLFVTVAGAITSGALRLLGLRRGWGSALLATALGWGVAVVVAFGLSGWDWSADGILLHLVAIGVPATMGAAVALDLLARPGSLAVGERAGLVTAPRPIRAVRRRVSVLRRYWELIRLARGEGFGRRRAEPDIDLESQAVRLRRLLESAGGVYVKLGQIAATRVDLLAPEVCEELAKLQNRVPPESREAIEAVLVEELGDVDVVFAEFEWEPLAAASVGQTHRARLHTGEHVVVKVQRPGIEATMERDLEALALLGGLAQRRTPFGRGMRSGDLVAHFASGLRAELDFRREADATTEMAGRLDEAHGVRVPAVHRRLCTRRVLVQECLDGRTLSDAARHEPVLDEPALGDQLLRSMLDQILRLGFFHADPHPGNVFLLADGTLGLIDFGAVGRLDPIQQAALIDMFVALAKRDVALLRDGVERVADVDGDASATDLERALARLLAEHVRPGGTIDADALQQLVVVLSEFGMRLPADVVLLSRALVTLDGTLRVLTADRTLMGSAFEVLDPSAPSPVVNRDQFVRDELAAMLPHLRRLPERVDRVLALTGRGELRVRHVVDEDGRRVLRTLVNRVLLVAVGAALLAVSAVLLVAADAGPAVTGRTGLFEVFGYGGLLAGVILVLRVVGAVARDGTT